MLPKHRSECDLEQPFQRAYFENEFGSKSIGEPNWRPHVRNALDYPNCQEHSSKGGNGLDWFSSIRCPQPVQQITKIQKKKKLEISNASQVEQTTPKREFRTHSVAVEYDDAQDCTRVWELTLEKSMGQKKKAWDCRNGVAERAPGDKSYHVPEYALQFHHHGSTLPLPSFGAMKTVPDTFIPLVKLPLKPRIPFHVKERKKEKAREINEVNELDHWKPAKQLCIS
ncbi:uncharacterized protein LOC114532419 [Dendronephthya gigantea]|uniref:uncharacterized protein LOC114532419 n=1 Tax=Dendronephthya gigantea TaxID=151771 RepID=UPI0010693E71|nr:uncharacterized protein LOC114532419 [Dendronephthya gigantea]XP_028409733.1 uncharacterized protein LOC114532419 [Dendronephthya gigantea]